MSRGPANNRRDLPGDLLSELPDDIRAQVTRLSDLSPDQRSAAATSLLAQYPGHADVLRRYLSAGETVVAGAQPSMGAGGSVARWPPAIGPYRIVDVLGEGGMGIVYRAEQLAPVRREVALKLIRAGCDSAAFLRRFELERQVLAVMNHENIARVFDAGTAENGLPYYALEYVPGAPITTYCDRTRLSIDDRVRLFLQVCAGVQHAHQRGVIHRDLTPRNVLVTDVDGRPVPKIIDFGLARATDAAAVRHSVYSAAGWIVGTWDYMSPEQADPGATAIDTRSDVYSLGAMLYELLTGDVPLRVSALQDAGVIERQLTLRQVLPARPSARVSAGQARDAVAAARGTTTRVLVRGLRVDLDWVVLSCLEKEPDRRYPTVEALAADLRRYLEHQAVSVGPPTAAYRLRKYVRRHRGQVTAAAFVALALVLGLIGTLWFALDARTRRAEFDQLASVVHLERALAAEKDLYPAWPENAPAMARWLQEDAGRLLAIRPQIQRTVENLEERARRQALGASEDFLRVTLANVTAGIDALVARESVAVRERLVWAQRIAALTQTHPGARVTWEAVRDAIAKADGVVASALYKACPIDLRPQTGLVPIGMNPVTKLWEFYELRSAWDPAAAGDPAALPIPRHDPASGHIAVGDDTGIVFVLLPGGTFLMGSQNADKAAPNYDGAARASEAPQAITLSPFFLARHELTQGQWRRLTGGDVPSGFKPGMSADGEKVTWANPVEAVDWHDCNLWLTRHGLMLPTEAQWEYGCRAGTTTTWWTGSTRETLRGAANLADQAAKRAGRRWFEIEDWPELDDGFVVHTVVDALRANPFGLHHVHGNVWEWCRDWVGNSSQPVRAGDGERLVPEGAARGKVRRGGSFNLAARDARSGRRDGDAPGTRYNPIGVRAARALRGAE